MALLGAAFAPVIHCSNWANRSIYFSAGKKPAQNRASQWSDGQSRFQLSKESLCFDSLVLESPEKRGWHSLKIFPFIKTIVISKGVSEPAFSSAGE
jgi:hypothetical protein